MKNAGRWTPEGPLPVLVALAALALAFGLRYALHEILGEYESFSFFYVAALLVCAYGGIWPSLLVVGGGLILGIYFFVPPFGAFGPITELDLVRVSTSLISMLTSVILIEWLQRTRYRAKILILGEKFRSKRLEETIARMERAEREARHSEQKLETIVATVPEILYVRRLDGKFEYVSGQFYELTGLPAGSLEEGGWIKAMHPEDAERITALTNKVAETGADEAGSFRLKLADGSYRHFDGHCHCTRDRHGKIIKWVGRASD
jgi:PAS domain S-box-containing protein